MENENNGSLIESKTQEQVDRENLIEKKTEEVLSLLSGLSYDEISTILHEATEKLWGITKNTPINTLKAN